MDPHWSQRESGWLWMIANQYSRAVQVHPGLTSWGILSRPYGTGLARNVHPGLTSWATLSRPCGTDRDLPRELTCFNECCSNQVTAKNSFCTRLAKTSAGRHFRVDLTPRNHPAEPALSLSKETAENQNCSSSFLHSRVVHLSLKNKAAIGVAAISPAEPALSLSKGTTESSPGR